jgi:membrane-associated phospholipid phosphatase
VNTGSAVSSQLSSWDARLANIPVAVHRLGKVRAKGVPSAAARRFAGLWPLWACAVVLTTLCAVGIDAASVGWVRDLPRPVNSFFQWLTDFGKSGWLLFPTGLFCLVLLLSDWRTVRQRVAAAWTEIGLIVGFSFLSIAGAGVTNNIFKQLVGRGRPVVFDRDGAFSLQPFQFDYAHASFPSGHATTMGALAVVIASVAPRARWPAFAVCAIVASSRVFVAAHYPSDVVAGFAFGAAFAWFLALALAEAGIAFAHGLEGTIKARAIAIRRIFSLSGGFSIAMGCLWLAVFGFGLPTAAV